MSSLCLWSQSTGKILKVSGKPTMLPRSPSWMRICILMHSETLGIHFQRTGFERNKYNSIWIKMHYGEVEKRRAESCHLWQISKVYHYSYTAHGVFVAVVGEATVRQELTLQRVRCQICIIVWHDGLILKVLTNWTLNRLVFAETSCLVICLFKLAIWLWLVCFWLGNGCQKAVFGTPQRLTSPLKLQKKPSKRGGADSLPHFSKGLRSSHKKMTF